jgi:hypothetical protein
VWTLFRGSAAAFGLYIVILLAAARGSKPLMPKPKNFQLDENGEIILFSVTGWLIGPVMEMAVLLAFQYAESEEAVVAGESKQIQFGMMPQQALELAAVLSKAANGILGAKGDTPN